VVDLHHRRRAAGSQAFDFGQREPPVCRGLSDADAQRFADKAGKPFSSPKRAWQRAADLNMMLSDGLGVEHGIETYHPAHPCWRLLHQPGDVFNRLPAEIAKFFLRETQYRQ